VIIKGPHLDNPTSDIYVHPTTRQGSTYTTHFTGHSYDIRMDSFDS
jgi:hypothetical protein